MRDRHGPGAVFGGSYGWSSAGRFHHAQSQVHRFLNVAMGGYVKSVNSYSSGAASVVVPHIIGDYEQLTKRNVSWEQIVDHSEIVLAFGGMALKNSMVAGGGTSKHVERGAMARAAARGCKFVHVSPLRGDLPEEARSEWISNIPGTDTALMLALVHTLVVEGMHDREFLDRYTAGWPVFERYVLGETDGQPKDAAWAAAITGVAADTIVALARKLHGRRALIVVSHSLQRAEHGEQPVWMGAVLAAALGQIGLPGGGYAYALGAIAYYGRRYNAVPTPTLSQGRTAFPNSSRSPASPTCCSIPAAPIATTARPGPIPTSAWSTGPAAIRSIITRISIACGALLRRSIRWWCMNWAGPRSARHADFVLPATMTLEREDIGGNANDPLLVPMQRIAPPYGEARDDYEIFADLAERLGAREAFTEGRNVRQWLEHLYEPTQEGAGGEQSAGARASTNSGRAMA